MKKILGGVVGILGVISLLSGTKKIYPLFQKTIPSLAKLPQKYLVVGGIILVFISLALFKQKAPQEKHPKEVPIYEEDKVVGYRRIKHKKKK